MGLQDRDYMHRRDQRDSPFVPPPSNAPPGWATILTLAVSAFVLFKGYEWLLELEARLQPTQQGSAQPLVVRPPVVDHTPSAPAPTRQWTKCTVNGQTLYSDTACQGTTPKAPEEPRPPTQANSGTATLYHCKAYTGGTFWARSHCNQHQALVDRMVNVPSRLPFEQQVHLAEANRRAASHSTPVNQPAAANGVAAWTDKDACKTLDDLIVHLDAMARQPQSAPTQDEIRERRKQARDRQFALRC